MANEDVPLLKIPPEMRLLIYEYLLRIEQAEPMTKGPFPKWHRKEVVHGVGLLRACKLLYEESRHFLYSKNWFAPETIRSLQKPRADCKVCNQRICGHQRDALPPFTEFAFARLGENRSLIKKLEFNYRFVAPYDPTPSRYYFGLGDEMLETIKEMRTTKLEAVLFYFELHSPRFSRHYGFEPGFIEELFQNPTASPAQVEMWKRAYHLRTRNLRRLIGIVEQIFDLQPCLRQWTRIPDWDGELPRSVDLFGHYPAGTPVEDGVSVLSDKLYDTGTDS